MEIAQPRSEMSRESDILYVLVDAERSVLAGLAARGAEKVDYIDAVEIEAEAGGGFRLEVNYDGGQIFYVALPPLAFGLAGNVARLIAASAQLRLMLAKDNI